MKLYIIRIEYHYEGSQDVLFSLDEGTARGFYQGYCKRIKEQHVGSKWISNQTDLVLSVVDIDQELEYGEGTTLIEKPWRQICAAQD